MHASIRRTAGLSLALLALAAPTQALAKPAKPKPVKPAVPKLIQPADGAKFEALPAFAWNPAARAVTYEFQLAADAGFNAPVLGRGKDTFETANTRATISSAVSNGNYWWRVRSIGRNDVPSAWSKGRKVVRAWVAAPNLLSPPRDDVISYPNEVLKMAWSPVDHAANYELRIASDPTMGSLVDIGAGAKPVETAATAVTPAKTLATGTYYWTVTPIDAQGHRGKASSVASFKWDWPSTTTPAVTDLATAVEVDDYRFSWTPIPGAARYQVEVNSSDSFAPGSKVCCDEPTTGTSLTSTDTLQNNVFYWRVRAQDQDGNFGVWNRGPDFDKTFDTVVPPIKNLHLSDNVSNFLSTGSTTGAPVISWDPVPGAASYQVEVGPYVGVCDFNPADTSQKWDIRTAATAWTPLGHGMHNVPPVPRNNTTINQDGLKELVDGQPYCFRVRARQNRDGFFKEVVGGYQYLETTPGTPAFTFDDGINAGAPACTAPCAPGYLGAADYLAPQAGTAHGRLPVFKWKPVQAPTGGPASYWILVFKDAAMTKLWDYAFTQIPAYAPRGQTTPYTYSDEISSYYWVVLPSANDNGSTAANVVELGHARDFVKSSAPPTLLTPSDGQTVTGQTEFRWTLAEGARTYQLQVSQDPSFGTLVQDVTTSSLSYTSSNSYPADTQLYWRVRANDETLIGLNWSATGRFQRTLARPVISAGNAPSGDLIPTWTWSYVPGAVSYDLRVEEPDGDITELKGYQQTAFTPTSMTGTGAFLWEVRANFPAATSTQLTPGPYSPRTSFTRTIGEPQGARTLANNQTKATTAFLNRVLLSWNAKAGAKQYLVEVSNSKSFKTIVDQVTTDNTAWAPTLLRGRWSGELYWRVTAVDADKNRGAPSPIQRIKLAKGMTVRANGRLAVKQNSTVTVTVLDFNRKPIKGAKVRFSAPGIIPTRTKSTNAKGTVMITLRAAKAGDVNIRVTKTGFQLNTAVLTAS